MAKKKRKKGKRPSRPQARPTQGARSREEVVARLETEREETRAPEAERPEGRRTRRREAPAPTSNRQARKEQARRERERRIKRARRARRLRRAVRWGLVLGMIGGVAVAIWYVNTRPLLLEDQAAARAAAALGCGEEGDGAIEEPGVQGREHLQAGQVPPEYNSTPATSGPHNPAAYQGPPVLPDPVDPVLETSLVHNLEHAYVIMSYRADGDGALPQEAVDRLTEITERESKVLLVQYPAEGPRALPDGASVTFTAWNKLLPCPEVEAGQVDQVATVAEGFIQQYRGSSNAPEPAGG
ncbi:MAG: DUF3105 domain-containing protein [Actinomycetota bacterium]